MRRHIHRPDELNLALGEAESLAIADVQETQQRWRETYARRLRAETGRWVHRGFDWHIFSWGYRDHIAGRKALAALEQELPATVLVFPDGRERDIFGFRGKMVAFPDDATRRDIIVAPPSLRWTFVWTHEDHCGPYFCQADRT